MSQWPPLIDLDYIDEYMKETTRQIDAVDNLSFLGKIFKAGKMLKEVERRTQYAKSALNDVRAVNGLPPIF